MRSFLPTLDLDHAFESKEKMATEIKDSVAKVRLGYRVEGGRLRVEGIGWSVEGIGLRVQGGGCRFEG